MNTPLDREAIPRKALESLLFHSEMAHTVLHGKNCQANDSGDDTCPMGDALREVRKWLFP